MATLLTGMRIPRSFQIEKMKLPTVIQVVLALQCAVLALIALDTVGAHVPLLRQLTSTVYLTFVPGLLILKIARVNLKIAPRLLFAIGLSLLALMGVGISLNFALPIIGLARPLSLAYLLAAITALTLVLLAWCYIKQERVPTRTTTLRQLTYLAHPVTLVLLLLPFIAIIGAFFVNAYNSNALLVLLIALISAIPVLVVLDRIPKRLYGLAIFVISLSLLYHRSLISAGLTGTDIFEEYYWGSQIVMHGLWNFAVPADYNSALSVVLILPIYSIYGNIDLVWVLKLVVPFLNACVPLGIFIALRRQIDGKMAFLSACLFVFGDAFYTVNWARQSIAELFLILLIILLVSRDLSTRARTALLSACGVGLIVSHYTSAYLFFALIVLSLLILSARQFGVFRRRAGRHSTQDSQLASRMAYSTVKRVLVIALLAAVVLGWNMYAGGSSAFMELIKLSQDTSHSMATFLNPSTNEALGLSLAGASSLLWTLKKDLYFVSLFFVAVGVLSATLWFVFHRPRFGLPERREGRNEFDDEYLSLSIAAFVLLSVALIIPVAASYVGAMRVYQYMLIVLAPFFLYGIIISLKLVYPAIRGRHGADHRPQRPFATALKLAAVFLVILMVVNAGLLHEIAKDPNPSSIAISSNQEYRQTLTYTAADRSGASFVGNYAAPKSLVATDSGGRELLRGYIYAGMWREYLDKLTDQTTTLENGEYVFLTQSNLREGLFLWYPTNPGAANPYVSNTTPERPYHQMTLESTPFYGSLLHKDRVYDNGYSQAFL